MQVGKWSWFVITNMTISFHPSGGTSSEDDGQISVIVHIRIANAAAVKKQNIVEQRSVSFWSVLELFKVFGKKRDVECIDFRHSRNLVWIISMVRKWMMRVRNPDFGIGTVARFTSDLECSDTRDVALERKQLQIEHQPGVICIRCGDSHRTLKIRQWIVLRIGLRVLNASLHLTNRIQIL